MSSFFTFTVGQEEGCPRIIQNNLFRTFTVETFNNGRYAGDACMFAETAFTCQQLADSSYHDYSVYWNSTKSFSFIFLANLRLFCATFVLVGSCKHVASSLHLQDPEHGVCVNACQVSSIRLGADVASESHDH